MYARTPSERGRFHLVRFRSSGNGNPYHLVPFFLFVPAKAKIYKKSIIHFHIPGREQEEDKSYISCPSFSPYLIISR